MNGFPMCTASICGGKGTSSCAAIAKDRTRLEVEEKLLEFMASEDSVLVHFWSPNCSAPLCYPLDYVHKAYASTGYTLIIIADYFDMEVINGQSIEGLQYPLFAVNGEYYDTDICYKYHERFVADLLKQDKKNIEKFTLYTRHMLFSKGKLVSTSPTKVLKKGT